MSKTKLIRPSNHIIGATQTVRKEDETVDNPFKQQKTNITQSKVDEEEFFKQLLTFKEKDFKSEWQGHDLRTDRYHIRVFVIQVLNGDLEITDVDGETRKSSESILGRKFTHLSRIVRVGSGVKDPLYKEGELVLLNPTEVMGVTVNPSYAVSMRAQEAFNYSPIDPKGMPKTIENIQAKFGPYCLLKPFEYDKPAHLIYDYAIPSHLITEAYKLQ